MTVTSLSVPELATYFLVFGLTGWAIALWRRRVPGLRGVESLRAATYLVRYSAGLEYYGLRA